MGLANFARFSEHDYDASNFFMLEALFWGLFAIWVRLQQQATQPAETEPLAVVTAFVYRITHSVLPHRSVPVFLFKCTMTDMTSAEEQLNFVRFTARKDLGIGEYQAVFFAGLMQLNESKFTIE
jgi:hypothetical protein